MCGLGLSSRRPSMKTLAILRQLEPRDRSGELPANAREATLRKHQVDITEKEDVEVVEEFGGPCRGRTYGPLIKSLVELLPI